MSQYPPQDFSQPQKPGMMKPVETTTSMAAIFSLIFGLLSMALTCFAGLFGVILGVVALVRINKSNGQVGGQALAIVGIVLSIVFSMFSMVLLALFLPGVLLLPAVQQVRQAARRTMTANEIRQIALSEHSYESAYQKFSGTGLDETTGSGLSWRVHILPFLGEDLLYQEFKLDEPWDSEHNKQLIYKMPAIYGAKLGSKGEQLLGEGQTTILRPVGNGAFPAIDDPLRSEGISFASIADGLPNTILLIEADASEAVTWTDPAGDYNFDPNDPTRGMGGQWMSGVNAAMADASVHNISVNPNQIRNGFTEDIGAMCTLSGND